MRIVICCICMWLFAVVAASAQTVSNPRFLDFDQVEWTQAGVVDTVIVDWYLNATPLPALPVQSSAAIPRSAVIASGGTPALRLPLITAGLNRPVTFGIEYVARMRVVGPGGTSALSAASNPFLTPFPVPSVPTGAVFRP